MTRNAKDIETVREIIAEKGKNIQIVAKIENNEGIQNYEEILQEADAIQICRNDIAMELPPQKVLIAQKYMVEKANLLGKPVFVHQQVFDSMVMMAKPNRSETSDVVTSVLDGVDAFVLDQETAEGEY